MGSSRRVRGNVGFVIVDDPDNALLYGVHAKVEQESDFKV